MSQFPEKIFVTKNEAVTKLLGRYVSSTSEVSFCVNFVNMYILLIMVISIVYFLQTQPWLLVWVTKDT